MWTVFLFKGANAHKDAVTKVNAQSVDGIIIQQNVSEPALHRQYQIFFLNLQQPTLLLNVQGAINHIRAWSNIPKRFVAPIPGIDPLQKCCSVIIKYRPEDTVPSEKQIQDWLKLALSKLKVAYR